MKIRMYNVGFGDCYCLRDRKKSLLVDFGTNNSRIEGRPRREIFDLIISDLSTIECKNLLLTHFHMDHLSGLLYMMKNKDRAVSRDELLKTIWQMYWEADTRAADDLVKSLRRKMRDIGSDVYVETVWGYGFRLSIKKEQI